MRARSFLGLAALAFFVSLVSPASSATPVPAHVDRVARAGELRPWLFSGGLTAKSTLAADVVAREAIRLHASWASSLELPTTETRAMGDGSNVVVMRQRIDSVPVLWRGARVVVEADGRATMLTTALEERRPSSTTPTIAREDAIRRAQKAGLAVETPKSALVVVPTGPAGSTPRLGWIVGGEIEGLPYRPVVVIDAHTGELLMQWDATQHAGAAKVYEQNPKSTPTLVDVTLDNDTTKEGLESTLVTARNCIDKKTTREVDIGFKLTVHTCQLMRTVVANSTGDYTDIKPGTDTEAEDVYAELSMYYHTQKAFKFVRTLGLSDAKSKQVTAVANLRIPQGFQPFDPAKLSDVTKPLLPFDNGFFAAKDPTFSAVFDVTTDAMWFGQGSFIDFGYDGDVVYHEFGHYVVNQTVNFVGSPHVDKYGLTVSPGAMNEAEADTFSCFMTGDPNVGEYAGKGIAAGGKGIRQLDNKQISPDSLLGEVHQDSNHFSAAGWKVYVTLDATKKTAFQKAWLKALTASPTGDLGYFDFAKLFITAVTNDVGADVGKALEASFAERGVIDGATRVRTYADPSVDAFDNRIGFTSFSKKDIASKGEIVPGVFQIKYDAPAGGTSVLHVAMTLSPARAGGSPFGGTTGTFVPKILAKASKDPIEFKYGPTSHDAQVADCTVAADKLSATCDVTLDVAGTYGTNAPVHLMVVNAGDAQGGYDQVKITAEGPPPPQAEPPPEDDAGTNPAQPGPTSDSGGCGCAIPGETGNEGGAVVLAMGALALLVSRRRAR